jgi:GT2 family glycosyltransferase
MIDVVVPAHNEATLIRACLWSVLNDDVKVIVVANGCTDNTAEAAAMPDVTVVEIPRADKAAALNAAEPYRRGCAVVYLDADTVLTPGTLEAMAAALDTSEPRLVGPAPMLVRPKTWLARGYAKVWSNLPAVAGQIVGGGCYAVNPAGRARWNEFPNVVADDAFVRTLFAAEEQQLAGEFLLVLPEGRELVNVVRRWRAGNAGLSTSPAASTKTNLKAVARKPPLWPHIPAFAAVVAAGRSQKEWSRAESLRPNKAAPIPPTVDVIVVTYNSAKTIDRCLASVQSQSSELTVTIVDNHSDDTTADHIDGPLIRNERNTGFAAAVNQAAQQGKGDYILMVNPDAELHEGAIDHLLTLAARFPEAGLYGGRAVDAHGRLDPTSCLARPTWWHATAFGTGLSAISRLDPDQLGGWQRDDIREVPALTGALLLVQRELWDRLGGFDERYFLYGEDVDLCLRATQLGAKPMFTPMAIHRHDGGGSSTPEARLIGILRGKATLYSEHVGTAARYALLAGVALRASAGSGIWRTAWRERQQWQHGWPLTRTP